jgi:hypothetical protein
MGSLPNWPKNLSRSKQHISVTAGTNSQQQISDKQHRAINNQQQKATADNQQHILTADAQKLATNNQHMCGTNIKNIHILKYMRRYYCMYAFLYFLPVF